MRFAALFLCVLPFARNISSITVLRATVADGEGVKAVYFLIDGSQVCTDTTSPYTCAWDSRSVPNGPHRLTVRAEDFAGNVGADSIDIVVDNPCLPRGKSRKCR